jgi:nucleoside-diphosphate-sugar epimerase
MWGAYDISRISADTGWRPRPVREALHAYMDWIAIEGDLGAPMGAGRVK